MIDKLTNEQFTVKVGVVIPFEKSEDKIKLVQDNEKRERKVVISLDKSEDT